jgi:hypothetical protein
MTRNDSGQFTLDINGVPVRGRYLAVERPHRLLLELGHAGSDRLPPGVSTAGPTSSSGSGPLGRSVTSPAHRLDRVAWPTGPGPLGFGAFPHIRDTTVAEDASQIPPAPLGFDDRSGIRPEAAVDA